MNKDLEEFLREKNHRIVNDPSFMTLPTDVNTKDPFNLYGLMQEYAEWYHSKKTLDKFNEPGKVLSLERPTLRDQFAMSSLSHLSDDYADPENVARLAYIIADAMIKQRNK